MEVSVIIVTKNRYPLLKKAVDSVFAQTYPVSEIIIVNDASNDDTAQYVNSLQEVRCIHNKVSVGGAAARNIGIEAATGEYVAFLDDDDQWDATKIEKQVSHVSHSGADIVYTGTTVIDEYGNRGAFCFHPRFVNSRLNICFLNFIGITSTVMIRRAVLDDEKFDIQMPALQEYELFIRLIRRGATVSGIPYSLVHYLQVSEEQTVSSGFINNLRASTHILKKHGRGVYCFFHMVGLFRILLQKCYRSKHFRKDLFNWLRGKTDVS